MYVQETDLKQDLEALNTNKTLILACWAVL